MTRATIAAALASVNETINQRERDTTQGKFMTHWKDSSEATAWIATADSRETSREIMQAIAFFARNQDEANRLWSGDGFGEICHASDLWEHVTGNGRRDASEFCWGAAGHKWWPIAE